MVRKLERGEIGIPELQREFVWKEQQVVDLADSIYRGYPVGMLTFYKVPERMREGRVEYWVLDGQQRLLSLYLIFHNSLDPLGVRAERVRRLYLWFNMKEERFCYSTTPQPRRLADEWVSVADIVRMDERTFAEFLASVHERWPQEPERERNLRLLWMSFRLTRKIPVHEIEENFDLEYLGEIFVRTNFAGTRVKGADVYSTVLAILQPGAVRDLREYVDRLYRGLGWDIDYAIAIRSFIAFLTDGKVKLASRVLDQASLLKDEMRKKQRYLNDILSKTKQSIRAAIDLLRDETLLAIIRPSRHYLPSQNVLVTMAYYIGLRRSLSNGERRGLLGWFVLASIFGRYRTATETRLNRDLKVITEGGNYKELVRELEQYEEDLKERLKKMHDWDTLFLYAVLRACGAKDPLTLQDIVAIDSTIHHIFPYACLAGTRFEELWDDLGNKTLVTPGTNQHIGSSEPESYLNQVPSGVRRAHLIPDEPELWKVDRYDQFLRERRRLLDEEGLNRFWSVFIP